MNREVDIQTLKTYIPPIERLPVLFKSEEESADASDIINIVLQNKKDIEELKEEIVRLKSVVLGMFNSSNNPTMINPPSTNHPSEMLIDYPEENVKKDSPVSLREMEKNAIIAALERNNGKRSAAAKELGFSERTLYRKMIDYDLNKKQ